MKSKITLTQAELQDGDIVTIQRALTEADMPQIQRKFTEVREFYDYLLNRITVRFAPKHNEGEDFTLALNKKLSYNDLARAVGEHLGVDPTFLRFCTVAYQTGRPKTTIRHTINYNLGNILSPAYAPYGTQIRNDALYYEVLECSMAELEQRRSIKITWLPEGQSKEEPHELLVQKTGTVGDLIAQLAQKANIPEAQQARVRVFEAHNHKNQKELAPAYPILSISDYAPIFADVRAEDELEPGENDVVVHGFSYDRETSKAHGFPFSFLLKHGEPLADAKERLGKRVGVGKKVLEKIKFTVVQKTSYVKPVVIEDDEILTEKLGQNDLLGLDYQPRNRGILGRVDQIFIK